MKLKILFFLFSLSIIKVFATGQEPDRIIIKGKEYELLNNPLEKYFENNPDDHPVYGPKIPEFKKYKDGERLLSFSTSNSRDYIAAFAIENSILRLVDIKIQNLNSESENYVSVFKKLFGNRKIALNYSGILIIPTGELIETADFGYSSLHTQYQLMTVNNDTVIKEKEVNKDGFIKFKINRFEGYKRTEEYKTELKNYLKDWEITKKQELSKENTRGMSKKEVTQLKKEYEQPPTEDHIDNFFFVIKNPDFVIIDY